MQRKTIILFFALLLLLVAASSSPAKPGGHRVSGVVVDADNGSPLAGVSVAATETGGQSQTNSKGRFSLTVPARAQMHLVFQKKGYHSVTKTIDTSTSAIIISMKRGN